MKKILTFLTIMTLISSVIFCCCMPQLVFAAQENSCCAKNTPVDSQDQCGVQNHRTSQGHSCECQTITSVLFATDLKITNSLAWTKSLVNPWTHVNLAEIFARHPLQHLSFFDTSPHLFASLIPFSKNPVLRL